jgi:hypothetical protein
MELGLELVGRNATWTLSDDRVVIEYSSSWGVPRLLRRIGSRGIPAEALAGARVGRGEGAAVLQLELRAGADPYLVAAAGQLPEDHDPYRLELQPGQEDLASYHAEGLRLLAEANPAVGEPCAKFLVDADTPPLRLKCYDGDAHLEADSLRFRWNGAASRTKRGQGDSVYPLSSLTGAEWVRPGVMSGHLAVRLAESSPSTVNVEEDSRVILFGLGYGGLADSLPFTASLLVGIQRCAGDAAGVIAHAAKGLLTSGATTGATGDIVSAIRVLSELAEAGLISEDEFARRKKELLDRL